MSIDFNHGSLELWNPALRVGFHFIESIAAIEDLLGLPTGIHERYTDTYDLDPEQLKSCLTGLRKVIVEERGLGTVVAPIYQILSALYVGAIGDRTSWPPLLEEETHQGCLLLYGPQGASRFVTGGRVLEGAATRTESPARPQSRAHGGNLALLTKNAAIRAADKTVWTGATSHALVYSRLFHSLRRLGGEPGLIKATESADTTCIIYNFNLENLRSCVAQLAKVLQGRFHSIYEAMIRPIFQLLCALYVAAVPDRRFWPELETSDVRAGLAAHFSPAALARFESGKPVISQD